jgi:hypothetical protein
MPPPLEIVYTLSFFESSNSFLLILLPEEETVDKGAAFGAALGAALGAAFLAVFAILLCIK